MIALIFLLFSSCLSAPTAQSKVVLFLEGLAVGVETDFGNVTACTQDLEISLDDFENGFTLVANGIRHLNIFNIKKGLDDFGAGLKEIKLAIDQCGTEEFAADISKIISDFSSWGGVVKFAYDELINFFHSYNALQTAFIGAENAFKVGDYFNAGKNCGLILGILIQNA